MKFNVFGRLVEVQRYNEEWVVYYLGNEGKKRKAANILVPSFVAEVELAEYLADLYHEWATPTNSAVKKISGKSVNKDL